MKKRIPENEEKVENRILKEGEIPKTSVCQ